MSEKLKGVTASVMDTIHKDHIKMRPKIYFIAGSVLTFLGLIASIIVSTFLVSLLQFSLRTHGPMGEYRWNQMVSNFPWWTTLVAVLGLCIGIWLLHQYDFSYKTNSFFLIVGFIVAIIVAGWALDSSGLNDILSTRRETRGMMMHYLNQNNSGYNIPYHSRWKYFCESSDSTDCFR